jgi:hypothetical protein
MSTPRIRRHGRELALSLSFALLQFNPSSVVVMDTDGRITSLNVNAQRLLSTTEAESVGSREDRSRS